VSTVCPLGGQRNGDIVPELELWLAHRRER
jgi:hypothetical protein